MVLHRTLIAAAVLAATAPAWASTEEAARAVEEPAQADAAEPASDEGESVVVRDRAGESLTSFTHLTREDIARRPTEDGNITDLLKSNPAVQFSNHGDGSLQMGEIKPSNISIHGSVAYQNNYTLDGISTNSDLDPAEQTSVTTTRLGGSDEQGFYVDSRLIDSVTVYDHNIPASFGGFTGGVIDAQTRSWSGENHISVFGRMTKSGWSRIHTDSALDVGSGDADVSKPAQFQTDFEKKTYGFTGEWGITDNLGVVVGYTRRESKIPTVQVPGTRVSIVPDDQNWTGWGVLETPVAGGAEAARSEATVSEGVLPTASAMKRRVLPNGMTVFLYPRRDATGSLEARLVVRAGSLQETEEERGLAHYVEHMAFNGTRDFPDQSAFKALEADGIMLGADVNAVTSLGGTTYRLSVPQATRTGLDTALHIMREWAFNITFRPEAFEREREIIVEEWRLREGVGARINGPLQTLRYEGSASRDRDPIGLIDVIRTAPVERAKAFYERWYSPQNMTLLLVGAFDEATADELIERYFASEPARGLETPADWGRFEPVANEDRLTTLVLDPEVSDRFVQIQLQRTLESTSDTVNEAWRETIERLTLDILGRRFALMKENGGQGSLQAPESSWILSPSETQVLLLARPGTDEPLEAALERASGALKTLAAFGPSKEELDAAVRARRDAVRSRRLAAVRISNASVADDFADAVVYRLPMLDETQQDEMVSAFLAEVTADHVRASASALLASRVKLGAVAGASEKTSKASLRAAWTKGVASPAKPWTEVRRTVSLDLTPPAGPVTAETTVLPSPTGSGRARRFEFANGLKLVIIEDPSLTGRTTLNLRLAGGTSAVDHGLLAVPAALTLPMRSGIGSLTAADIRRVARDAKVSVMSYAEQLHHGIRAEADPEGVPAMMAILHARLSAPRFDEKALADMRRDRIRDLEHAPAERRFMDAIARDAFTAGGTMVAGRDDVDALASTEKLSALEAKLLGDPSRMTVTIVTRESVEKTYEEAAPWLASLAKRGEGFEFWRDQGVRPASGTGVKVWPWATADKAMVQMHYRSAMPWSEADADRLSLIGYAANRALRESLRTKASGVYVVNLNPLLVKEPAPYFIGRLNFTSAPARAEDLARRADEVLKTLARTGIDAAAFEELKAEWRVRHERDVRDAYYWCESAAMTDGSRTAFEDLAGRTARFEAIGLEDTNRLLATLFGDEPRTYMMTPADRRSAATAGDK